MEDYFEGFPEDIIKWEIIRELTDLDLDDKDNVPNVPHETEPGVQLLPRQDVMLYGTIPKMEQRIYSKCRECRLVFNPRDILSHKNCSGKVHVHQQNLKKKVKSKGSSSKKTHSNVPPPPLFKKPSSPPLTAIVTTASTSLPELKVSVTKVVLPKIPKLSPVTSTSTSTTLTSSLSKSELRVSSAIHVPKVTSVNSPKSPSKAVGLHSSHSPKALTKAATTTDISTTMTTTTYTSPSSSHSSSSSSSRHKKSRRNNTSTKTIAKEYDPDVHCGVIEGSRGPCTRSITCSNHRIQLRKLVSGRSKDIHQLIAERKAAKEKDLKHSSSSCSYMSPNGSEEKEIFCQNTSYVPTVAKIVNTIETTPITTSYVPIMSKVSTRQITTSVLASKKTNVIETDTDTSRTMINGYINQTQNLDNNSQDSATVPVVFMPMSPISVISPVQFVQIGKNMICLESPQSAMSPPLKNKSVFLTIPNSSQHSSVKIYKSHPKPVVLSTFGTRKVGGAILLSNPDIESQRNELLTALNTRSKTINNNRAVSLLNHCNTPHRPNILKVKSVTKNCKRPTSEKLTTSDNKQMRLVPDVNGFILHADVSESADAPQSNNCIQEKIALLNMK